MDNSTGKKDTRFNIKFDRKYLPSWQALRGITKGSSDGEVIELAVRIINARSNE